MRVAIDTDSTDHKEISKEFYNKICTALEKSGINYEYVDVLDISKAITQEDK